MKWAIVFYVWVGSVGPTPFFDRVVMPQRYNRLADCMVVGLPNAHMGTRVGVVVCEQVSR